MRIPRVGAGAPLRADVALGAAGIGRAAAVGDPVLHRRLEPRIALLIDPHVLEVIYYQVGRQCNSFVFSLTSYLDAADESGGVGRFQSAEDDSGRHQAGQFRIDGHGFLVEAVVGVEPELALHPLEFGPVPFAVVERLRVGQRELARFPGDAQFPTDGLRGS